MIQLILSVINLIYLILKNKTDYDDKERLRKEKLHEDWADAIKSGDINRINDIVLKLRS